MSVIEQAAKRLEVLRRAGVDVPWSPIPSGAAPQEGVATPGQGIAVPGSAHVERAADVVHTGAKLPSSQPRHSKTVQLDLDGLGKKGFLVPALAGSGMAREFRSIKHPLLKIARNNESRAAKRSNIIMLSSAMPGEGKTFCAINLAMSIAMEVDSSALLVDADVQRPSLLSQLGVPTSAGLLDVLSDPSLDLSSLLLKTNVPKLTLLASGSRNAKSNELLASAAMERLLDEIATRYPDRVVIVDSPPLLLTTESRVLASRVGQTVLVVEASQTTHSSVARALAALEPCPHVHAVLNKCDASSELGGYGYYGYY